MNLGTIFLTGLTTGGLSCLAMQGGLLASIMANQKEKELDATSNSPLSSSSLTLRKDMVSVSLFLISKIIVHTLLGFLLGWLGSKVELSLTVRLFFQGFAALFMFATAANLLQLHPIFRYVVFQPPKFIQRLIRKSTKNTTFFAPVVLGVLTIFIPCGVTQAMEVLAITSANPLYGAALMFVFVLGTSPLFALVGIATARLSDRFRQHFMKVAAFLLILLGLSSLNGILVVVDAPITINKMQQSVQNFFSPSNSEVKVDAGNLSSKNMQQVTIDVKRNGYSPNRIRVKAGVPVELTLVTSNTYTCASSFVLRAFNIQMQLGPTDRKSVVFTPEKKGQYAFTCSMGMYSGVLEVI
ncbi:sulfite exporter TauE/SafE family protein [Candidatus Woesebacteria bacterium]|nr:sulfite exporter TauE/SafE family protein [Candidatus Woesebacteria bacterium]